MRASRSAAFRSGQVGELWREHWLGAELPGVMRLELRTPRKLHLPTAWPWTETLEAAFEKLQTLPAATG